MKMFNKTAYDRQKSRQVEYIDTPTNKRRINSTNKPTGGVLRRGFSGFHQPETVSVNKMREMNEGYLTGVYSTKPILSSFRKKDDRPLKLNFLNTKSSFRQTATQFPSKTKQKHQETFWQTAANGFSLHNRPMSKQQPRNNKPNIKQLIKDDDLTEEIYIDEDSVDSNIEDMDEQDKANILNFQKSSNNHEILIRQQRPQTSKGFRKKMTSMSDLEVSADQNLLDQLKKHKIPQHNFEQIKIPIRSMYYDKKNNNHPSSAHPNSHNKASRQFEDLLKVTNNSPKKNSIDMTVPFESLIGSEFLSLFANGKE